MSPNIFGCHTAKQSGSLASRDKSETIFNGKDLSGWVNVNDAPGTWLIEENTLVCTGKVPSNLRTSRQYENYILDFDYVTGAASGKAAIILHSGALPDPGQPVPTGISCGFIQHQPKTDSNTINTDVWNHCQVLCNNSKIQVTINKQKILSRKVHKQLHGYINFSSIGQAMKIRDIRIKELPSATPLSSLLNEDNNGFQSLYNNNDLSKWNMLPGHLDHWTPMDGLINYDGKSTEKDKCLWTKKSYRDFILVADVRLTRKPEMAKSPVILPNGDNALNMDGSNKEVDIAYAGDTGIYLRGNSKSQVNIGYRYLGSGEIYGYRVDKTLPENVRAAVTPKFKADRTPGEWNRFVITLKGDRITVILNDQTVINNAQLPGIPSQGPIALQDDHADNNLFQFANIYVREL
jgi:hypothetical protein